MIDGRWLNSADTRLHLRSVVLGEGIAKQYGYLPGETRTIRLNDTNFGVVGVLGPVALDPELDNAAFVTQWAAKHVLGTNGQPEPALRPRHTGHDAGRPPTPCRRRSTSAVPTQVSTQIPTDVLQAAAQANKTLQQVALLAGLLALTVGGIGIANVMSISVIQRSSEIGIRRAVGHSRSKIGCPVPPGGAVRGRAGRDSSAPSSAWPSCTSSPPGRMGRRDRLPADPHLDGSRPVWSRWSPASTPPSRRRALSRSRRLRLG